MGTNFYHEVELCDKCRNSDRIHIGKSSAPVTSAGREMDALVAETIFRTRVHRSTHPGDEREIYDRRLMRPGDNWPTVEIPHYSTSIADAWLVVEKLREDGWAIGLSIDDEPWDAADEDGTHACSLLGCNRGRSDATDIRTYATTTPLAICLAALKAAPVTRALDA